MDSIKLAQKIRRHAVDMVHRSHASHIGAAMSVADILAVLYADVINYDAENPNWDGRDRVVLSKGHAGTAMYAALAECGFFPVEDLEDYYQNGSCLSGHISHKGVPGVEFSTGSLGHGMAVACGLALGAKLQGKPFHTYAIVGDGECEEGMVWEAAMIAAHQKLNHLTVIVDHNGMQALGDCDEVAGLGSLKAKWESFGWNTIELPDGNDHKALWKALRMTDPERPTCIVAHTVKGKGVSFMENQLLWHYRDPQGEAYEQAVRELGEL